MSAQFFFRQKCCQLSLSGLRCQTEENRWFTNAHTHLDPKKKSLETRPCPDRRLLVLLNYKTPICVSVPATGLAEWETSPRVSVNGKPHSAPRTAHCPGQSYNGDNWTQVGKHCTAIKATEPRTDAWPGLCAWPGTEQTGKEATSWL